MPKDGSTKHKGTGGLTDRVRLSGIDASLAPAIAPALLLLGRQARHFLDSLVVLLHGIDGFVLFFPFIESFIGTFVQPLGVVRVTTA